MFDLARLRRQVIVSCQAPEGSPLRSPAIMAAVAEAAVAGGAAAIRANGAADIRAIRNRSSIPIIGLLKRQGPSGAIWITPTLHDAQSIAEAGADVIAVDATLRHREFGSDAPDLIAQIRRELGMTVLADVDNLEAAQAAQDAGADAVATTLAGYTTARSRTNGTAPDVHLVATVAAGVSIPVIAEGRYQSARDVLDAFEAGAHAVVVGTAITDPMELTRRIVVAVDPERSW